MRRMRSRAAAWLVGWFALAACAPALNWREFRAANLTALLPCKPQHAERSVPLGARTVRLALDHCDAAGATWAIARADVGDPREVGAALVALREAALRNIEAAAPGTDEATQVPGMTPHTQARRVGATGRRPGGAAVELQTAVFVHGTTVWQATVLAPRIDADAAATFFGAARFVAS
jgi:hypothetical protein